jgi:hypothetical protein
MGKEEYEQGVKSEDIVHQICEKIFLFNSNEYTGESSKENDDSGKKN